jgi:hypothetical protein
MKADSIAPLEYDITNTNNCKNENTYKNIDLILLVFKAR